MSEYLKAVQGKLFSSVVEFERAGASVRFVLFPAVHIGRREYYAELMSRMRECRFVLYEGFGAGAFEHRRRAPSDSGEGLVGQTDAIDYRRLPVGWIRADMKGAEAVEAVGRLAVHERFLLNNVNLMQLAAASVFSLPIATRRTLAELVASAESLPLVLPLFERLTKLITADREAVAYRKLRQFAPTLWPEPICVGVFYGAAHMRAIAAYLTSVLGYARSRSEWIKESVF